MSTNTNIDKLLEKALEKKVGGVSSWYNSVPVEAEPFIKGIADMIRAGKKPVSSSVTRILNEEFNIPVSRSRVDVWLKKITLEQENQQ